MALTPALFPPAPQGVKGRAKELNALTKRITEGGVRRIALVGGGGSGKSLLACVLGHRLKRYFSGGAHWLRVGAWDTSTLVEMLCRRLGAPGTADISSLKDSLNRKGPILIVLDNHENDRALAAFIELLRDCPVTWIITARRCLLSGVEVFPVIAPLISSSEAAFPRVAQLTKLLRWNPLALDIADGLVSTKAVSAAALRKWLLQAGVDRVTVMAHEDDVPEVRLLVAWAWAKLSREARQLLAALAHTEGDDIDEASLYRLARIGTDGKALAALIAWRLIQQPLLNRYTVHAVVRYAIRQRTRFPARRFFDHYVKLMERDPARVRLEQSHLFAAMDYAHQTSDLGAALRIERLLALLETREC